MEDNLKKMADAFDENNESEEVKCDPAIESKLEQSGYSEPKPTNIYSYIGAKIINAEPMDSVDFAKEKNQPHGHENAPGYKVYYPDGYVSWSPKNVFEEAYRPINQKEVNLLR